MENGYFVSCSGKVRLDASFGIASTCIFSFQRICSMVASVSHTNKLELEVYKIL